MSSSIASMTNASGVITALPTNSSRANQLSGGATQSSVEAAVINAIDVNAVPFDTASYAAILGSIKSAGGSFASGTGEQAALQQVMGMIGKTISQGQGGYYIAINAPHGSMATSMTPGQLKAYMQSDGTLYPDTVVAQNATYTVYGLLQQAFAANAKTERLQAAGDAMDDPRLKMAESLLDQMKGDSAPTGSMESVLFGSKSLSHDAGKSIRTLVLQMHGDSSNRVRLTIVYYPPGVGNYTLGQSTQSDSAPATLQLNA